MQATEEALADELAGLDEIESLERQGSSLLAAKEEGPAIEEDPALHGIFFEDQRGYDYMQHLKPMGQDPAAVFVAAPQSKN